MTCANPCLWDDHSALFGMHSHSGNGMNPGVMKHSPVVRRLGLPLARSVPDSTGGGGEQRRMTVWKPFDPLISDPQVNLWVEY